ncbi:MAG: putative exported protein [Deltaproteobacteria bacterium]|nr:putative exported protein [Deltaproteobacteria bacterium]
MQKRTMGTTNRMLRSFVFATCLALIFTFSLANVAIAKTAKEIDSEVNEALNLFSKQVEGAKEFLNTAKGVLVIPNIVKAGLGVGGQYGEGAMRIAGRTVAYYSVAAGSVGLQIGAQKTNLVLVFRQDEALKKFRAGSGWKAGVDGSMVFIDAGAGKSLDTMNVRDPIVAFLFGQQGLMASAAIEGGKFTKLVR